MKNFKSALLIVFASLFLFASDANASVFKAVGALYIGITNPVEWITGRTRVYEEQHMTPQQYHGGDTNIDSVILISRTNHTVSDRWKNKSYIDRHDNIVLSLLTFGNSGSQERLNAAYRMGCYAMPFSLFCFDYRKDTWHLVATELDACSNLLYGITWVINTPQKFINKIAYICQMGSEPSIFTLLDIPVNLVSMVVEAGCAVVGTVAGVVLGLICHPIDSLCSILGMLYFLVFSVITAVWDLLTGLLSLVTFWR